MTSTEDKDPDPTIMNMETDRAKAHMDAWRPVVSVHVGLFVAVVLPTAWLDFYTKFIL